jgi:hypothetical protein
MGYIDDDQLAERAHALLKSGYGSYLLQLLEQRRRGVQQPPSRSTAGTLTPGIIRKYSW